MNLLIKCFVCRFLVLNFCFFNSGSNFFLSDFFFVSKFFILIFFPEFSYKCLYKILYFDKIYTCKTFLFEQICINNLEHKFCIQ